MLLNCSRLTLGAYPFYVGGDISLETFMQQQNITFTQNNVAAPLDQIMYDSGANMFRLRVFVNPPTTYTNANTGAIQTTAYDITLAQQIKADDPGAKILLDFHYSDTWADPGHQTKPVHVNQGLGWDADTTLAGLESDVQTYTQNTLTSFKNAGVMPDMVQIGNETTDGMLWQTGSSGAAAVGGRILYQNTPYSGLGLTNNKPTQAQTNQSWKNFGGLLNAAIAGVRDAQSLGQHIPIALSIDSGDMNDQPQSFYSNITSVSLGNVTDFDVEGVDYYPSSNNSQKSFSFLQSNLTALANINTNNGTNINPSKRIMLLETDYPYTGTANGGTEPISTWPATQAGQEAELAAVRNLMLSLPGHDGEGLLYWYPEAVQVPGFFINNGGTTALFGSTSSHNALAALSAFAPLQGDFNGDGQFNSSDIPAMLSALTNLTAFESTNSITQPELLDLGDFNHDGVVNNADLQGMLNALLAGSGSTNPVPEPAPVWLLAISATVALRSCRRRSKM
ncbi:MAG TPA: glycosyl hydrolase 53 family protein [Pirellulales bacterium]|nr:glycosyl hydrolase 53 family protein [Pirellulales bacterium]